MASSPTSFPGAPIEAADGYWVQSRQPLTSLVFIAPLLVTYELGMLVFGRAAVQNGADAWLRNLLHIIGFGPFFCLPMLTVCALLAWHHLTRQPWRIRMRVLYGMAAESCGLAVCLCLSWPLQKMLFSSMPGPAASPPGDLGRLLSIDSGLSNAIGFLGAGIYEELLFRLILLSLVVWTLRQLIADARTSLYVGILLTSVLFAAAHYVGTYGEPIDLDTFLFRLLAGVFFSILFVCRGFGIAVGTHAVYDILVGVLFA